MNVSWSNGYSLVDNSPQMCLRRKWGLIVVTNMQGIRIYQDLNKTIRMKENIRKTHKKSNITEFTVWNSRSDRKRENVPAPLPSCCGSPCTPDISAGWGLFLNMSHPAGKILPSALASSPSSSPSVWIGGSHLRRAPVTKSTVLTYY